MSKLFCLVLATACSFCSSANADIVVSGSSTSYQSTSGDWLSNTADDIDGNGLGTDGFLFFGDFDGTAENNQPFSHSVATQPSYVTGFASGADFLSVADDFAGYGSIDNPNTLDGTNAVGGTLVARNGTGLPAGNFVDDIMSFTIAGLAPNETVRVGVLSNMEGNNDGRWDPTSITLTDGTFSATVGDHATSPLAAGAPNVGWVFFDVDADGTYTIQGTKRLNGNQGVGIGGLTFDSVPEPSSAVVLFGLCGLAFKRRRKS